MNELERKLARALWQVYQRPERPAPWVHGGNLPWNEPSFSERMLREHLDESHGAASRQTAERQMQIDWMWDKLALEPDARLLDVTCGPGLYAVAFAQRGCSVVGYDFGPAALAHARALAVRGGVANRCRFIEQDVRQMEVAGSDIDAALMIYGQLAVFRVEETQALLSEIAGALRPSGRLCVELLDQTRVVKTDSTWWYTDDKGLWGDAPYLHLGERLWYAEDELSLERFQIIALESGEMTEIQLVDQTYSVEKMTDMMREAGFHQVDVYPAWGGLPLYDAAEWIVYIAEVP